MRPDDVGARGCGASACRDGRSPFAGASPWALDPSVLEAGAGIPFCDEAMARVATFMGRFKGQEPSSERYSGTAVVGQPSEMSGGMNAHIVALYQSQHHQMFVNLMTLVRYDRELNPAPYLAESWEVSTDGTELTFHLRDDVYWHDGELTDAYDVAYTVERAADPATAFPNDGWWTYVETGPGAVEVIDPLTVRVRMTPHADFMDLWTVLAIMPQHLVEDVPAAELRAHPYGSVCPVGNGPFIFVEHRQGASWTFQANPAFPEGLGGRPYLDRYVYRIVTNQTALLTDLLTETPRAKGLSEPVVIFKHALRNGLIPIITLLGLYLPFLFSGTVFIEYVFSWPGMGKLVVDAITARDYPVIMGGSLIFANMVVVGNLVSDVLYAVVDPRIRYD